jgi:hypothetical protein
MSRPVGQINRGPLSAGKASIFASTMIICDIRSE